MNVKNFLMKEKRRKYALVKAFDFEKAAQFRDRIKAMKASRIYEETVASRTGG